MSSKRTLIGSSIIPIRFVFFMWLVFVLTSVYQVDFGGLGIVPRTIPGLIGIFTAPLVHAGPIHLISNTIPLLFLGITLFYNYKGIAKRVFYGCYLFTNTLVWLFARPSSHIGASGLIYALATFVICFGLFRRDIRSLIISAIVILMYGSIYYGILPQDPRISWESHLFGAVVGLILAWVFYDRKRIYK
ncbi:MAG TPA: rhomboid family intramembrane serine protease [Fulvivirga sp.]|nr:rhomboid family intramembrane serine protease [Fulvivirga sp.]